MFDTIRCSAVTLCDLDVAAYLMLMGCKLEGVTVHAKSRGSFTLTGRRVPDLIHDFKHGKMIRFSPRVYMELRRDLKRLVPDPADIPDICK
jgi:hypothetical protein